MIIREYKAFTKSGSPIRTIQLHALLNGTFILKTYEWNKEIHSWQGKERIDYFDTLEDAINSFNTGLMYENL